MNKVSFIELGIGLLIGVAVSIALFFLSGREISVDACAIIGVIVALFITTWFILHRILVLLKISFDSCNRVGDMLRKIDFK